VIFALYLFIPPLVAIPRIDLQSASSIITHNPLNLLCDILTAQFILGSNIVQEPFPSDQSIREKFERSFQGHDL
jgi:hypothetical protein